MTNPSGRNVARPQFDGEHTPLHVTLRMAPAVWNLRSQRGFACVSRALAAERRRGELRVVHFSVQGNHVHLVVEATDRVVLGRRMQGFGIRLARAVNAMMGRRRGRVLGDRYHARALRTPREVHRVIAYVLLNHAKHTGRAPTVDRFSSAPRFTHLSRRIERPLNDGPPLELPARTWLLSRSWQRLGPIALGADPGTA